MEPSVARQKLLAQHGHLRTLLDGTRQLRDAFLGGAAVADQLLARLDDLRAAFKDHNELETEWLEPLLREGDAWAPLRIARMLEEHAEEHRVFQAFFQRSLLEMAEGFEDLVEDIDAHMAAEERTFLSSAVLKDDIVADGGPSS
jgi:hypothetical protein